MSLRHGIRFLGDASVGALLLLALLAARAAETSSLASPMLADAGTQQIQQQQGQDATNVAAQQSQPVPQTKRGFWQFLETRRSSPPPVTARATPPLATAEPVEPVATAAVPKPAVPLPKAVPPPPVVVAAPPPPAAAAVARVQFFSSEVEADNIVFVVDCSSSMSGSPFARLKYELAQSVGNLSSHQKFYVLFFHSEPVPMFNNPRLRKLVTATGGQKTKFLRWLSGMGTLGGTHPHEALLMAARMSPDAVYLLTDGEFSPLGDPLIAEFTRRKIPINTLAFEYQGAERLLQEIARETNGKYHFIPRDDRYLQLMQSLGGATIGELRTHLAQRDRSSISAVIQMAQQRDFDLTEDLVLLVDDPDAEIRKLVRAGLVAASGGADFGPFENATAPERATARRLWEQWLKLRKEFKKRGAESIRPVLSDSDPELRLVAVATTFQEELDFGPELIDRLKDDSPIVAQWAHQALVQLAEDEDFGPAEGADATEQEAAQTRWRTWNAERQEQAAANMLKLVRPLAEKKSPAAKARLQRIVDQYPETKAAAEARRLLGGL